MGNNLTKKEELMLEEYKIGMDAYYRSETIYANRENFFFIAMGIIVAAIVELLKQFNTYGIFTIALVGLILSVIWYKIEEKSFYLSGRKLERLMRIEKKMSRTMPRTSYQHNEKIFKFFTITNSKDTRHMKTSMLRKCIPMLFGIFFILFCLLIWAVIDVICWYKLVV